MKKKYGGIIPLGVDPIKKKITKNYSKNLYFSHGRSAMIWLLKNYNFDAAILCAYTWPAIPRLINKYSLKNYFYDFYEKNIDHLIESIEGSILLIVPIFYGSRPLLNYKRISQKYKNKIHLLLDGAQTSFAHIDYAVPTNGSILSCPHKSTSLNDGAILFSKSFNKKMIANYNNLKEGIKFSKIKKKSRKLMSLNNKQKELEGLLLIKSQEEVWKSDPPRKMTNISKKTLFYLDAKKHKLIRRRNFFYLKKLLNDILPPLLDFKKGTPFAYPTIVNNRATFLKKLHNNNVYATALWYDIKLNKKKFPYAYKFSKKLIAFPIDQRYSLKDLKLMAKIIKLSLSKNNVIPNN